MKQRTNYILPTVAAIIVSSTNGFIIQQHHHLRPLPISSSSSSSLSSPLNTNQNTPNALQMIANSVVPSEPEKVIDQNGVEFTADCTIQTCSELKAYHVSKKGFGSFDEESKSFVALEGFDDVKLGDIPRAHRCLTIPKGMRGTVKKVYDMSEFDATAPIIVRFEANDALGGDYVPPVTFLMHFEANEVEVV